MLRGPDSSSQVDDFEHQVCAVKYKQSYNFSKRQTHIILPFYTIKVKVVYCNK